MSSKTRCAMLEVDRISLAVRFAQSLRWRAEEIRTSTQQGAIDILIPLFPWLSRFNIEADGGSGLHWKCTDSAFDERAIVFSNPALAENEIRDWLLDEIDKREQEIIVRRLRDED